MSSYKCIEKVEELNEMTHNFVACDASGGCICL